MESLSRREVIASLGAGVGAVALTAGNMQTANAQLATDISKDSKLFPAPPIERGASPDVPPFAVRVLNKAAYGPARGDVAAFNALGSNDDARLAAWVNQQLNPGSSDPDVDARLSGLTFPGQSYDTINKSNIALWTEHVRSDDFGLRNRPREQSMRQMLLRGAYSRWQLREVLADFWHNHFNIDIELRNETRGYFPAWDRDIRQHMFGNFRDMLRNTTRNAAMLYYLDNAFNTWPNPNENYAREVLELHTVGAIENFFGAVEPDTVPNNIKGERAGYTEIDVFQFARALTGWGVADGRQGDNLDNGTFLFRADRHYDEHAQEPIRVMDITINSDGGINDVEQILTYLARHYGTARFIAMKLCRRLIGDNVPESLIASTADEFWNRRDEANQLREVYRHVLLSEEFKNTWGDKARRPTETLLRAWRAVGIDYTPKLNEDEGENISSALLSRLQQAGHRPFHMEPPTGYPDFKAFWQGTGTMVFTWRTISYFLTRNNSDDLAINLVQQTNQLVPTVSQRTPANVVSAWLQQAYGFLPETETINKVAGFMAQIADVGVNEQLENSMDTSNTSNGGEYNRVLRATVGLIVMLPVGQQR
ncbi:MAG: DUF1800 domain-containing protein [Gammaproteobacteria bacterium]|nr:DUF1800 domain-containing protein [Gammaproteobacteria bacterium]